MAFVSNSLVSIRHVTSGSGNVVLTGSKLSTGKNGNISCMSASLIPHKESKYVPKGGNGIRWMNDLRFYAFFNTLKEIISQTAQYLVSLSSNTYVFEDKVTKH